MLRVTKSKKKNIPSALHVDNTARVQTVNKKQNKRFYSIINEFYKLTNIPVILNTSFNDAGEPLVETPRDALITSLKTNIDYLILENFLITFKNISKNKKKLLLKKLEEQRSKIIKKNYKNGIKILTKKYSKKELKKRIKEENKKAIYNTLHKPFDLTKKYFEDFNKSKKLIIIGTNDHTNILLRLFQNQINKIKNIDYFEIAKNDVYKKRVKIKNLKKINKLSFNSKSNFFISSYQYRDEISEKIKLKNTYFSPYDNSSRSLIDYYFIKNFKNKKKIHSVYKV